MRVRDQNKGDLALAALTLSVTAAVAGSEVARWAIKRLRRGNDSGTSSASVGHGEGALRNVLNWLPKG